MGRKRSRPAKKKKGGLLIGLRGGVQKAVGAGKADSDEPEKKKPWYKGMNLFWNVLTAAAVVLAGAVLLRRCGVVQW